MVQADRARVRRRDALERACVAGVAGLLSGGCGAALAARSTGGAVTSRAHVAGVGVACAAAGAGVGLAAHRLRVRRAVLARWKAAAAVVSQLARELHDQSGARDGTRYPAALNLALLALASDVVPKAQTPRPRQREELPPIALAARFMRFAWAPYGCALLATLGCWDAPEPPPLVGLDPEWQDRQTVASHCRVPASDVWHVAEMRGEAVDCPRFAVAVDHHTRSVVLAIRGTASISDGLVHDLVCKPEPFLGGHAHAGFANAANVLHRVAGPPLAEAAAAHPDYDVVLCGHSLGAGAASLLTLRFLDEQRRGNEAGAAPTIPPDRRVRCFAFAPPPVFSGEPPPGAHDAIFAVARTADVVPHLSFERVHATMLAIAAIDRLDLTTGDRFALVVGLKTPPPVLLDAAMTAARQNSFLPLGLPCTTVTVLDSDGAAEVEDAGAFFAQPLPLSPNMVLSHLPNSYQHALSKAAMRSPLASAPA